MAYGAHGAPGLLAVGERRTLIFSPLSPFCFGEKKCAFRAVDYEQTLRQTALVPRAFDAVQVVASELGRKRRAAAPARRPHGAAQEISRANRRKKTAAAEIRRLIFSIPRRRPPLPNLPPVPRSPPQIRTCARVLAAPQSPRPAAASCSTAETRLQSRPCCASALRKTSCSIGVHGARGRECELELGSPGPRAPNSASEVETSGSMGP